MLKHHCQRVTAGTDASPARSTRVIAVASAVVALSAVDLMLTHTTMATSGLYESNPVARLIAHQGAGALAAFKGATVLTFLSVVIPFRARLACEIAVWCGLGLLLFVSLQWAQYLHETFSAFDSALAVDGFSDVTLVQFGR